MEIRQDFGICDETGYKIMKLKLLFVISDMMGGGAERSMSNITTHLPDNVEADLLLNSVSEVDFPTDARIINLGMKPTIKKNLVYQLWANTKRIRALRKLKKKNQYDACISFMDSANICNILTKCKDCKTIISVRQAPTQDKSFIYQNIVIPLAKVLYRKADYVVGVSKGVTHSLICDFKIPEEHVGTIVNGYDVSVIMQKSLEKIENEEKYKDKFVFINIGRYTYQKAQWHLIRAFARIALKRSDVLLLLIGQGEEEEYLKSLIREYRLENQVVLVPYCINPYSYLRLSSVFVMPSMYEGYCNALCEALICGIPCIATDFQSSAREILAPDTNQAYQLRENVELAKYGILTPVCSGKKYQVSDELEQSERLLSEAMLKLYEDKLLYEKYQQVIQECSKWMDINVRVREWIELIQAINKNK